MKILAAAIFALLLCLVHCEPFTVKIFTRSDYEVGSDVICEITITNNQNKDYFVLMRNTPLEGLRSNIFLITKDTEPILYDGFFYKRGPPVKEEYILVKTNSSVRSSVDLSSTYSFSSAGKYQMKLQMTLNFSEGNIPGSHLQQVSNAKEFLLATSDKQPKLTIAEILRRNTTKVLKSPSTKSEFAARYPSFRGSGTSSDKSTATTAYLAAYSVLSKSYQSVDSNPTLYSKWFGSTTYYKNTVKGVYLDIEDAMERYTYTLYFHGPSCPPGVVAYTYHGASVVYLCDGYFSAPTRGTDSKMGTIVHEMSHAVAYTEDLAYGQRNCQTLASSNPSQAANNADNYEYFAESQ